MSSAHILSKGTWLGSNQIGAISSLAAGPPWKAVTRKTARAGGGGEAEGVGEDDSRSHRSGRISSSSGSMRRCSGSSGSSCCKSGGSGGSGSGGSGSRAPTVHLPRLRLVIENEVQQANVVQVLRLRRDVRLFKQLCMCKRVGNTVVGS